MQTVKAKNAGAGAEKGRLGRRKAREEKYLLNICMDTAVSRLACISMSSLTLASVSRTQRHIWVWSKEKGDKETNILIFGM